jgi:O-antigen/teichoic acid export membrane protein
MPTLLNLFFGTIANAAYSVAMQVYGNVANLSFAFSQATNPQIQSSQGEGNKARAESLAVSSSKYMFLLSTLLSVPLIVNINFVLSVWLKTVPPQAGMFCALTLAWFALAMVHFSLAILIEGNGKIAGYKIWTALANLSAFPIAFACLKLTDSPLGVFGGLCVSEFFTMLIRIYFAHSLCRISLRNYFSNMLKIILLVSISASATYAISLAPYPSPWLRLACTTALSTTLMLGGLWWALDANERRFARGLALRAQAQLADFSIFRAPMRRQNEKSATVKKGNNSCHKR